MHSRFTNVLGELVQNIVQVFDGQRPLNYGGPRGDDLV
jgi:hypothetical protein